jgi:hypothetical protein
MSGNTLTIPAQRGATVITPRVRGCSVRRYYDPATGQFISVDPLVDHTESPYAYASQDPVNTYDLEGTVAAAQLDAWMVNPTCEITGCGAGTNFAQDHTSLLRLAVVGVASVAVVATGALADDFVASALADASEDGAGFRMLARDLFKGKVERQAAIRELRIRAGAANRAAENTLLNIGGQTPVSMIRRAAVAWVRTLWRGF